MKKTTLIMFVALGFVILNFNTHSARASYIGIGHGNDKTGDVNSVILGSDFVIPENYELTSLAKINVPAEGVSTEEWGDFLLGGSSSEGTWTSTLIGVDFITVKAGNEFAVYSVNDPASGSWTTELLTNKWGTPHDLSHISFWSATSTPQPHGGGGGGGGQVPEPVSMILLASGLLGYFGFKRKFKK